jgi:hypothetical protein
MNFSSGPLPRPTGGPAAAEPHPLQPMLDEAMVLLSSRDHMKSNSSAALTRLVVRILESVVHGAPRTPLPRSTDHPEDLEERPQPSLPRRL